MFRTSLLLVLLFLSIHTSSSRDRDRDARTHVLFLGEKDGRDTARAVSHFRETREIGFQAAGMPRFVISSPDDKFLFGIGGFVAFRTAVDFDGSIPGHDFVTSDIPVGAAETDRGRFDMDATTSRLFFKTIANTESLGRIVGYIETDFRGANNVLRLRKAYVAVQDFMLGRNITTFSDLLASPSTIDFQGPNSYVYTYALMVNYTHAFSDRWTVGAAVELPQTEITTNDYTAEVNQRVPNIPVFLAYYWNGRASHLRLAGMYRQLSYRRLADRKIRHVTGWGVQASGAVKLDARWSALGQFVYGSGIGHYIQDLTGEEYDLLPVEGENGRLAAVPGMGWHAGLKYGIGRRVSLSGTYGNVKLFQRYGFSDLYPESFRSSDYIVGNVFFNLTDYFTLAAEYLHGQRQNRNGQIGSANRIQLMARFNF